jgi:hypothetical protein
MRITKTKTCATVVLGRDSILTRKATSDGRDLDSARRALRTVAGDFCVKHGLLQYTVLACKAHGGFTVDVVEL